MPTPNTTVNPVDLDKITGLQSDANKLDANTLKTFTKKVKQYYRNRRIK